MRVNGQVKFFDKTKGWGFITRDDGKPDVFVHKAQLARTGLEELEPGDHVNFEVESTDKGDRATAVKVLRAAGVR